MRTPPPLNACNTFIDCTFSWMLMAKNDILGDCAGELRLNLLQRLVSVPETATSASIMTPNARRSARLPLLQLRGKLRGNRSTRFLHQLSCFLGGGIWGQRVNVEDPGAHLWNLPSICLLYAEKPHFADYFALIAKWYLFPLNFPLTAEITRLLSSLLVVLVVAVVEFCISFLYPLP